MFQSGKQFWTIRIHNLIKNNITRHNKVFVSAVLMNSTNETHKFLRVQKESLPFNQMVSIPDSLVKLELFPQKSLSQYGYNSI
jgi:hypothetical protein